MDFPAWEVLSSLSDKGNVVAMDMLLRWETYLSQDVKEKALVDGITKLYGEKNGIAPEVREDAYTPPSYSYWTNIDLRIKDLIVSGYRGIPYEKFYGLSFTKTNRFVDIENFEDNEICSLIVMGLNGSGKTSLYSAIELATLNNTSIERKHKVVGNENINKFRHFLGSIGKPIHIYVRTNENVTPRFCELNQSSKYFDIISHLNLSPFFCSESELAILECSGISMTDYIDNTIGLDEISKAIEILKGIGKYFNDNYTELNNTIKGEARDPNDIEALNLKLWGELGKQVTNVLYGLNKKKAEVSCSIRLQAQSIIESLLREYESDDVKLSFTLMKDEKRMFDGMLRIKRDGDKINPRHYFNNFRFKLYMVSIQIAIAFYIMKSRKIQFPLIFDDIFDSSDFTNRTKSKDFFEKILEQYHNLEISDKPLQLIFFTQDEIIAESIYDGILECRNDPEKNYNVACSKLVQLFPPKDANPGNKSEDIRNVTLDLQNNDEEKKTKEAGKTPFSYLNLYDVVREFHYLQ